MATVRKATKLSTLRANGGVVTPDLLDRNLDRIGALLEAQSSEYRGLFANAYAATYAAARLIAGSAAGQSLLVGGRLTARDGGEGQFVWRVGSATDNGGTILVVPGSGGYWLRKAVAITPRMFGAVGDNATNDRVAINNCIQALATQTPKTVDFEGLSYFLGAIGGSETLFYMVGLGDGITFYMDGCELSFTATHDSTENYLFQLSGNSKFIVFGSYRIYDTALDYEYTASFPWGVVGWKVQKNCHFVDFGNGSYEGIREAISIDGYEAANPAYLTSDITIKARLKRCFYGAVVVGGVERVTMDVFGEDTARVFFVYNVRNVKIKCTSLDQSPRGVPIIKDYSVYLQPTEDIDVDFTAITSSGGPSRDFMELSQDLTNATDTGRIKNISIKYSVIANAACTNATAGGIGLQVIGAGSELTSNVHAVFDGLRIDGRGNGIYTYDLLSAHTLAAGIDKGRGYWKPWHKLDPSWARCVKNEDTAHKSDQTLNAATLTCDSNTQVVNVDYTTTGACTVTMPLYPDDGHEITVIDSGGNAAINNITLAGNGRNISGAANQVLVGNYVAATVRYSLAKDAWFMI